ncbi:MAG TPA: hypothetical protein VFR89_00920 [candidate division Zixibacteria bacterium]|nr:hypothetical protein [candidate division Zixibacteria bacterium]
MDKMSTLNLIAVIFFLFGLAGIVYALVRKITGIRAARKGEQIRFRQGMQIFLPLVVGLVFVLTAQALFWLSSQRTNFRVLEFNSPQAQIEVKQAKDESFFIEFQEGGKGGPVKVPYLKPNIKVVTQVVVWKPFFSFLGPMHTARVTRIEFIDEAGASFIFTNSDQAADFAEWVLNVNKFLPIAIVRTVETDPRVLSAGQKYRLFVNMDEAELKAI